MSLSASKLRNKDYKFMILKALNLERQEKDDIRKDHDHFYLKIFYITVIRATDRALDQEKIISLI